MVVGIAHTQWPHVSVSTGRQSCLDPTDLRSRTGRVRVGCVTTLAIVEGYVGVVYSMGAQVICQITAAVRLYSVQHTDTRSTRNLLR